MDTRKLYIALGVGALALVGLTACAGVLPGNNELPSAPTPSRAITLTLWHTQSGAPARLLSTLANDFHKAYPNLTVRAEQKSNEGDLLRQGLAAIALNQTPDLILASPRTIAEFARKGALVNLDPLLHDAKQGLTEADRQDWFPGILDAARFPDPKNQLFGLPFDASAVVLYYNADLLKAAKVDAPPRTWEQFSAAARATTQGNARGWAMSPDAAVFYACLFSQGGSVLTARATQPRAQFDDAAGLRTLQLIAALTKGGAAYLADSKDSARSDLAQGKAALWFGATDDLAPLAEATTRAPDSSQWGVTNVPQNDPSRPLTTVFGASLALFKSAPSGANDIADARVRAAWSFARWLTLPEQSARWSRATLTIPVRLSAQLLLANNLPPNLQRLRDGFGDTLPAGRALPTVKDAGLIDAAIVEMWTSVANGADPAAALKNAATRVNWILGQTP
jgi:ABC-type glycerol-3-phosphate transport system substrate-binding protein